MNDQTNKRSAVVSQTGEHGRSGKKQRAAQAVINRQEVEEGEVISQGSEGERAVETMDDDAHINVRIAVTLLHCRACSHPLKPPTFKCKAAHVVCSTCRDSHSQVCDRAGAGAYAACAELDAFVQDAKLPCAFREHGCESYVAYHEQAEHRRACPDHGCALFSSPARLLEHLGARHSRPVTSVSYGKPCRLAVPPPRGWHVLVAGEDRRVFLVSASALGAATAVAVVCVRANGGAAGAPQFVCKLWVEAPRGRAYMGMMMSVVRSSNLSRGFVAADQGMFLAVPPELLRDAAGEAAVLTVRIDRAGAAAGSSTPPARSSEVPFLGSNCPANWHLYNLIMAPKRSMCSYMPCTDTIRTVGEKWRSK